MSQVYRMGFQDIAKDSQVSREFIKKYILASSGEDDKDNLRLREENGTPRIPNMIYHTSQLCGPFKY